MEFLEVIREEEDLLMWEIGLPGEESNRKELERKLQIFREIKAIVEKHFDKTAS
jgi:hypothetical protein